ncbi:MAG TPA: hypothetical protein DCS17_03870 [Flavobacterium sp.]|nr:hypothetical protein [Flavobacterium sp.]
MNIDQKLATLSVEEKQDLIIESLKTINSTQQREDMLLGLISRLNMSKKDIREIPFALNNIHDLESLIKKVEAMDEEEKTERVSKSITQITSLPTKVRTTVLLGVFALFTHFNVMADVLRDSPLGEADAVWA